MKKTRLSWLLDTVGLIATVGCLLTMIDGFHTNPLLSGVVVCLLAASTIVQTRRMYVNTKAR